MALQHVLSQRRSLADEGESGVLGVVIPLRVGKSGQLLESPSEKGRGSREGSKGEKIDQGIQRIVRLGHRDWRERVLHVVGMHSENSSHGPQSIPVPMIHCVNLD